MQVDEEVRNVNQANEQTVENNELRFNDLKKFTVKLKVLYKIKQLLIYFLQGVTN